ncbi:MAG: vitamin K epoxide reductase family protein [Candidatus Pacearchaeota archaeon]
MEIKIKNIKYKVILVLIVISLISSVLLSFTSVPDEFCGIDGSSDGCSIVHSSPYNYFLGIPNSHYGVAIFLFLSILTYFQIIKPSKEKRDIIHFSLVIGSVVAMYFLYLQHFVINAYCTYCVITDFSVLAALIVAISKWRE